MEHCLKMIRSVYCWAYYRFITIRNGVVKSLYSFTLSFTTCCFFFDFPFFFFSFPFLPLTTSFSLILLFHLLCPDHTFQCLILQGTHNQGGQAHLVKMLTKSSI